MAHIGVDGKGVDYIDLQTLSPVITESVVFNCSLIVLNSFAIMIPLKTESPQVCMPKQRPEGIVEYILTNNYLKSNRF